MMKKSIALVAAFMAFSFCGAMAQPDPNFHLYLVFGQSNMAGGCKTPLIQGDCDTTSRVKLLAFTTCKNRVSEACGEYTLNRVHNQWYTAFPPYHNCGEGIGPADYFGKTLLDSIREDITIGFIPSALSGQSIDVFVKGSTATIPGWAHGIVNDSAYDWMVARGKLARQKGVIKGILFHHGETDAGNPAWVDKVKGVFDDLKRDLDLGDSLPIVVGELLQDTGACCAGHNPLVRKLASECSHCGLASSQGLKMRPGDTWKAHFDCPGMRELGRRFAREFLKMASPAYVPRKTTVGMAPARPPKAATMRTWDDGVRIFTLHGRLLKEGHVLEAIEALRRAGTGNAHIFFPESSGAAK